MSRSQLNEILTDYDGVLAGEIALPISPRLILELKGSDRIRYLNGQVTSDVASLQEKHSQYSSICTNKGKMVGDGWISKNTDSFFVDADPSLEETLTARLDRYIIADDVELVDVSQSWKIFHLITQRQLDAKLTFQSKRYNTPGIDIWLPADQEYEQPVCSAKTATAIRIEAAMPLWGKDISEKSLPPEGNLDKLAISYSKGCYTGQEPIARIKSKGHVNKKLCLLKTDHDTCPNLPTELTRNGEKSGILTSSSFSPKHQAIIALGLIKRGLQETGTQHTSGDIIWEIIDLPY
ncbi:MAG: glycine cleavage T C-terminal barrel domain-containing protein [Verrucomicrobiota bacterium]